MSTLERAIVIATEAHRNQKDKAGAPYILHPLRVMLRMPDEASRIVAMLHDVIEDSAWSLDGLSGSGFSQEVVNGVDAVTKRPGESYDEFVLRAAANPIGRVVKLADLEDNCDLSRIVELTDDDIKRLRKYKRAILQIKSRTASGS